MRVPLWAEKTLLTAALWALFLFGYAALNDWNQTREARSVAIGLDHEIPFQPAWIVAYAFVYMFVLLPMPVVRERSTFRRCALAYLAVMLASFALFALFPVRYPRPEIGGRIDSFLAWGVGLNYALDHPNNCLPSLHIGLAYLAAFCAWRVTRLGGALAVVVATAIALSTLFIKQHYVLDIVAGLALAVVAYATIVRPGRAAHTT